MAYSDIVNAFASSLSAETITIQGDSTQRGGTASSSGGVFINRFGQISGSGSSVTLEGGSSDWSDSISQTNVMPYYTRAQQMAVSSIKKYLASMAPTTFVDDQT